MLSRVGLNGLPTADAAAFVEQCHRPLRKQQLQNMENAFVVGYVFLSMLC